MLQWIKGMQLLRAGCKDMLHPRIRYFIILPLIINALIFGGLFYYGFTYSIEKLDSILIFSLPDWLAWLKGAIVLFKYLLIAVLFVISFIFFSILATLVANWLACPFNSLLSETFSKTLGYSLPHSYSFQTMLAKTFSRELKKLGYYLPKAIVVGILCFGLQFIPPLNLVTPVIFYGFSAWMMAIQYIDYPADNHQVSFLELLTKMKDQKSLCLGFGLSVALVSVVPLLNLFIMPAAVLAATRLWHIINESSR